MKNKLNQLLKVSNFKKIKRDIFLFLITGFAFISFINAQVTNKDYDIKWSNNIKTNINYQNMKILMVNNNNFYFYFTLENGKPIVGIPMIYETIMKYDRKTESVKHFPLKLQTDGASRKRLDIIAVDSVIHIISYFNNKKNSAVYIFDETINMKTFESNNDIHKFTEIDYDKKLIKNSDDIHIVLCTDELATKNRIILHYFYENKKDEIHGYEVFDNKFLSRAKYENSSEKNIGVFNYTFDNDFNLYTIERIFIENDFLLSHLSIVYYQKDGSSIIRKDLSLGNLFITEQTLSVNNNNQVICAGLYSHKGTRSALGGFSIKFEPKLKDNEIVNKIEFGQEFITNGFDEQEAAKIKKKIESDKDFDTKYYYSLHNIHYRKDGGFDIIIEKLGKEYIGTSSCIYNYGDLYVLSFNADGSSKWNRKIFRNQVIKESSNDYHLLGDCFIDYGKDDEINIIFNSINSFNPLQLTFTNESKTLLTSINTNGLMSEKTLFTDSKLVKTICPGFSINFGSGKYFLTKLNYLNVIINSTFNIGELEIK